MDITKKEIEPGDDVVMTAILESPVGFGEHLKVRTMISVRNGLVEVGRAMILEVIGYFDEIEVQKKKD